MKLIANMILPNPLNYMENTLVLYQSLTEIKNLRPNSNFDHDYIEIRLKLIQKDLEKDKFQILTCLK